VTSPATLERTSMKDDHDIGHFTCCDDDISYCGIDVSDHELVGPDKVNCKMCLYIDVEGLPCTVPGCGYWW
jgi:hypothetical protein